MLSDTGLIMVKKLLGNLSQGMIFVVSAPAGTGKNTLVNMLKEEFDCVVESVSCTTRQPRQGEVDGRDYHFLSVEEFEKKIKAGDFLEYAKVYGNYYGTSKEYVFAEQARGHHVILVIDTQGAMQVRKMVEACCIFLSPPSMEKLRERLTKRKTESVQEAEMRLAMAQEEMASIDQYDYCVINDHLETAYQALRSILISEEHRIKKGNHGI
jgi:guanylate kinase